MTLHSDDIKALDFNFDKNEFADDRDHRVAQALGVDIHGPRALATVILEDMPGPGNDHVSKDPSGKWVADETRFGIRWWTGYSLGTKRRILIGDYLHEVAHTLGVNLLEARLHFSAARDALEHAGSMRPTTGTAYLHDQYCSLHVGGMLRAVGSAADCVATATIGVLGLHSAGVKRVPAFDLTFSHFGTLEKWESRVLPTLTDSEATRLQRSTVKEVRDAFEGKEAEGWFDWARSYRNTFVHRGRRHHHWHDGLGMRLPSQPDRSEAQALVLSKYPEALCEPCEVTLEGVLSNVQSAVTRVCAALVSAWRTRMATPALIEQPIEHWRDPTPAPTGKFLGFGPREIEHRDTAVVSNATLQRMANCAAPWKSLWDTFS